jgi:branched-chain amino acid aminotransferase
MSLKFEIQPATNPTSEKERAARLVDPGFGRIFTDHMAVVRYNQAKGWHGARVEARANFPLDPAAAVLHYAQEIFEGLKAYNRDDGGVNLFRPDANAWRFWNSAERMAPASPMARPSAKGSTASTWISILVIDNLLSCSGSSGRQ